MRNIKKIAFFVGKNAQEPAKILTKEFADALRKRNIETLVKEVQEDFLDPSVIQECKAAAVDITCSFQPRETFGSGTSLEGLTGVPHVTFLDTPLIYSTFYAAKEKKCMFAGWDRTDVKLAQAQFPLSIFLPPATPCACEPAANEARDLDLVLFADFFDFMEIRKRWKGSLSAQHSWAMDFAIDVLLINSSITLTESLKTAMEMIGWKFSFGDQSLLLLYDYLVRFMAGKDRFELVNSIRDVDVHVFGDVSQEMKSRFKGKTTIHFHPKPTHGEAMDILKRSKICLNSGVANRDGANEWVFYALSQGAAPITSFSKYLKETLADGENLHFYFANHWQEINGWIQALLQDEDKRKRMVHSGQEKIRQHHSLENRADEFLSQLAILSL